jgi:hypothetical protein
MYSGLLPNLETLRPAPNYVEITEDRVMKYRSIVNIRAAAAT